MAGDLHRSGGDIKEIYGVPGEEIVEGIKHGVRKVNIDTDLRLASTGAMRRLMATNPSEFDPRKFFGVTVTVTVTAMRDVCIALVLKNPQRCGFFVAEKMFAKAKGEESIE